MKEACAHCGSEKIIPKVPLLDHYGDTGFRADQAEVRVHGNPQAWLFKDTVAGKLSLRVCGECGHAELRVSNYRELYAKYAQAPQASEAPPRVREGACLSCGKPIPVEAAGCPSCGWTWGAEEAPT